jgi:hypothetical protein
MYRYIGALLCVLCACVVLPVRGGSLWYVYIREAGKTLYQDKVMDQPIVRDGVLTVDYDHDWSINLVGTTVYWSERPIEWEEDLNDQPESGWYVWVREDEHNVLVAINELAPYRRANGVISIPISNTYIGDYTIHSYNASVIWSEVDIEIR